MKYLISLLTILTAFTINAEPIEKIVLKDGSVLEGHIVSQVPGDSIRFESEIATIVLSNEAIKQPINLGKDIELNSLPKAWIEWASVNKDKLKKKGNKYYLQFTAITKNNKDKELDEKYPLFSQLSPNEVFVSQKGANIIYVDIERKTYNIKNKHIKEINKISRDRNAISGVVDVIETQDTVLRGQIVSQVLGEYIIILPDGNNVLEEVKQDDILSQKKEQLNKSQDFFEQVPYIDVVNYGKKDNKEGIIIYQGKDGNEACIKILTQNGNEVKVPLNDINCITKKKNKTYKPFIDIEIENDSIYLCRKNVEKLQAKPAKDKEIDYYVEFERNVVPVFKPKDKILTIECRDSKENQDFTLIKFKKREHNKKPPYGFSYKDLAMYGIKPSKIYEPTINGTLRLEYTLDPDMYLLYRKSDSKCVIFIISE